jgi:hypothetical protein
MTRSWTGSLFVLLLATTVSQAAPIYYTASDVLPAGLATLTAERTNFQLGAAGLGVVLSSEGFEVFAAGNPIDFGPFTIELVDGVGFSQLTGNNLITTEGDSVISFDTLGSTVVEFAFDSPIHAFGVDITSIDFAPTTVSFLDDLGNTLDDFAEAEFASATFFGVTNDAAFSTVRFTFTGTETLNFDNLQFGARSAVPEPATLGMGLSACAIALVYARSRRRKSG